LTVPGVVTLIPPSSNGGLTLEHDYPVPPPVPTGPDPSRSDRRDLRSWRRAGLLFALTLLTTFTAGATMAGGRVPGGLALLGWLATGWSFALPLLFILVCHEFGHYLAARAHRVDVSPPYFIPFPNLIGTLGAFIAIRSPILNRRQLLDIGAAGPLAGFLPALVLLLIGYRFSTLQALPPVPPGFTLPVFGDSLLTLAVQTLFFGPVPDGMGLFLHPVAFAGWVGMLVTMLNLLPLGQLDGGHIAYALLGRRQWRIAPWILAALFLLGAAGARWWWYILGFLGVMMLVLVVVGRIRYGAWLPLGSLWKGHLLRHPPVANEEPLDERRRRVAWATAVVFLLTFVPVPISFLGS
jgi:membrane-associated protease RseP (regulator of RpoE activity)